MRLDIEIMQAQYKKEAKKADARLRALEDAARKYKDSKYTDYAYRKAQRELGAAGLGNRFDKVINDPDTKRLEALKKQKDWFPEDMTEKEFLKITQLGVWDLLSDDFGFGYQTAIRIAKALTGNKKYIMNRKSKMTRERMEKILGKVKFKNDPELFDIVQGVLNR